MGAPLGMRAQLATLTGAKTVANTALRWVGPFLPTLERAFNTTTGTMTGIMGIAELGGLTTAATGPILDRGHERRVFVLGLVAVACSSAIALGGTVTTFAVSFVLLVIGVGNLTVAGHAWIGHRVPFGARSRAIGAFETSWALALLVGAPALALLIRWFGWRGPYVALIVAGGIAAVVAWLLVPASSGAHTAPGSEIGRLPSTAWPPLIAAASIAASGIGMFVVSGVWLDDAYGVSTGGLGLIAAGLGAVELMSSTAVAMFADRIGARRSVVLGVLVVGGGLSLMWIAGSSRPMAIAGLAIFLCGFEYAFVSSLTMVTEAAPAARGKAIGYGNTLGTVARSVALIASGQLYERFGIDGSIVWSASAAALAVVAVSLTRLPSR